MAAPKAHRTQKRLTNGDWFMRITAGRHAGAAVLFTCTGASKLDCEAQIAAAADEINERYAAVRAGRPTLTTIGGLLDAWERSAEFEGKAESTKAERSRIIAAIKASPLGKASASLLKQAGATGVITKQRDRWAETHGLRSADATAPVLLANRKGKRYAPKGIGDLVADVTKSCGYDDLHLHDAKGTFVTRLCTETDLTDQEIAGLVDWSVANVRSIKHKYVSGAAVSAALLKRFRRA